MLISVCRHQHVSEDLDKSLETEKNRRSREKFADRAMPTSTLNG
jgi:hypothetical protein